MEVPRDVVTTPVSCFENFKIPAATIRSVDNHQSTRRKFPRQTANRHLRITQMLQQLTHDDQIVRAILESVQVCLNVAMNQLDPVLFRAANNVFIELNIERDRLDFGVW